MKHSGIMVVAIGLMACGSAAWADQPVLPSHAPDLDKIAGVYKHDFDNADVDGHGYRSEDIFELVKTSAHTAYFRIHGEFFNGHQCNLSGIADLTPEALVYYGPLTTVGGANEKKPCVLKFTVNDKGIILNDVDGVCRDFSCGARGGYDFGQEVTYPFAWQRRIRYMPRLVASTQYKEALQAHAAHKIGTPAPGSY